MEARVVHQTTRHAGEALGRVDRRRRDGGHARWRPGVLAAFVTATAGLPCLGEDGFINSIGMQLAPIPPGSFAMGSPRGAPDSSDDERPVRTVRITRAFYMAALPVTNRQYRQFRPEHKSPAYKAQTQDLGAQPVVGVSWHDAVAFCAWLSGRDRRPYRLPTEAEWEYACRAGSKTAYCFGGGTKMLGRFAAYKRGRNSPTKLVGLKLPNRWGLYDMHGNVWEWCQDWYADRYDGADRINPQGPARGTERVVRGGSVRMEAKDCRSASRKSCEPDRRVSHIGFRVVCTEATRDVLRTPGSAGDVGERADAPRTPPPGRGPKRAARAAPKRATPASPKRAQWQDDLSRFREALVRALAAIDIPEGRNGSDELKAKVEKLAVKAADPFIGRTVVWRITYQGIQDDGTIKFKEDFPASFEGTTVGETNGFVRLQITPSGTSLGRWRMLRSGQTAECHARIEAIHTGSRAGRCWLPIVKLVDARPAER